MRVVIAKTSAGGSRLTPAGTTSAEPPGEPEGTIRRYEAVDAAGLDSLAGLSLLPPELDEPSDPDPDPDFEPASDPASFVVLAPVSDLESDPDPDPDPAPFEEDLSEEELDRLSAARVSVL